MSKTQDKRGHGRPISRPLVAIAVVLGLGACQALVTFFGGGPRGPVFPHAPHIEEEMDCTTCHPGAEDEAAPGFPESIQACMLCHTGIEEEKPDAIKIASFLVNEKPSWANRPDPNRGDVRFHHGKHAEAEVECVQCHAPQVEGKGEGLHIAGGKATCLECHAKTERGKDCSVCHEVMRKDVAPPSHRGNWHRLHGDYSRYVIEGLGETTCAQCHAENACTQCHREEKPASHTNFWRLRGHGLTAAVDRTSCANCHEPDYCVRCHKDTRPQSHRGAFGPPRNLHCATCHLPATGLSCGACHESFPAHVEGPNTPGNAAHGNARSPTDCLTCHLALEHPNPGGDCRTCHK